MNQGTCIHYNGLNNTPCGAGHKYLDIAIPPNQEQIDWHNENYPELDIAGTAIVKRIPCFVKNDIHTCPDFREPTQAELDQDEAEMTVAIEDVVKSYVAVIAYYKKNKRRRSTKGEIPCPICQVGILQFGRPAYYNEHIHARCTTPNCVQWVQ